MESEKRKEYFIFTSIFWWIGVVLYGGLAVAGKDILKIPLNIFWVVLIYGIGGGWLLGGLACGIIFFSRFFKRQVLLVRVILCVLFPFTVMCIIYVGIFLFFPYGIYNLVIWKKEKIEQGYPC